MNINSETRLLGLFGNPSRHSLSPLVQNHFIEHHSLNYRYLSFEPETGRLKEAFDGVKTLGFLGLNITMPFKEEIINYIDRTSGAALVIEAVNTVKFTGKSPESNGYSTDGDGVIKALEDAGFDWKQKECLILGAGGAAKSAIFSIIKKPVSRIFIYDILKEKPGELINKFKQNIKNISADKNKILIDVHDRSVSDIEKKVVLISDLNEAGNRLDSIDLIINCTPVGMDIDGFKGLIPLPDNWSLKDKFVFDMVYKPIETEFLKKARKDGAGGIINGIDMLVSQGVYSFKIWFDIMPEDRIIRQVKNKIRKYLSQQY